LAQCAKIAEMGYTQSLEVDLEVGPPAFTISPAGLPNLAITTVAQVRSSFGCVK
jgi:hypothetical protein